MSLTFTVSFYGNNKNGLLFPLSKQGEAITFSRQCIDTYYTQLPTEARELTTRNSHLPAPHFMTKPEIITCPACNKLFECSARNIELCQCMEVNLSVATKELIRNKYCGCLCKECLLIEENILQIIKNNI